ncbi:MULTISPECIES: helix-turn-helix transcriptional regulator [Rhizobium]|uniref:helix-turn-helix transcriptional regulator n=1 Tax=Rhizobium phaseoli TaxID=396 RepID=UPI000A1EB62A|nr:AlpA family phage regulatory protein [Rhizobium phaseoli]
MDEQHPAPRLLRLRSILAPKGPIPISKSTWWKKVRSGEYPAGIKLGPRTTAWRQDDVVALIKRLEGAKNESE